MNYITNKQSESRLNFTIGGKAENLFRLQSAGFNVPPFIVIPQETLLNIFSADLISEMNYNTAKTALDNFGIAEEFIEEVKLFFKGASHFAVRSSAIDEDGTDFSFAGQFESFLYVDRE